MAQLIQVELGARSYPISIAREGFGAVPDTVSGQSVLLVSDSNVAPRHGGRAAAWLEAAGCKVRRAVVPAGENSKSLDMAGRLFGEAVTAGLDRGSVVVALGGGMVGDLAGFVAGTFLRGIACVQLPTTMLAMVDSSIGGKTAVNLPQGKNLVGVFQQPVAVAIDLSALVTLPDREYVSGLAEVVKYGVISDADLFSLIERSVEALRKRDVAVLEAVVARCCAIKAEMVSRDERERGPRALLNFGHTMGHAIEAVAGYEALLHGEAVAIGMVYAARVSAAERGFPAADEARLAKLLRALGLPVTAPRGLDWDALRSAMATDKKTRGGTPRFVLADRIGQCAFGCRVDESRLSAAIASVLA
jgi:3-dehydroquinate synthase